MSEERKEVFRGHLDECFKHYCVKANFHATRGSNRAAEAKRPMAEFCGVEVSSVTRWIRGGGFPLGDVMLKLMCFLDVIGYRVIELEKMSKYRRGFAELIGYGLLSGDEAAKATGYSHTSTLFQIFLGNGNPSKGKEELMWNMWKQRREELEKKKVECQKLYASPSRSQPKTDDVRQKLTSTPPSNKALVNIMEGLLELLKESSPDEDFGDSVDTVLQLSAKMSSLSSRLIMQKKEGS